MDDRELLDLLDDLSIAVVGMTADALGQGGPERDLTLGQWRALVLIAAGDGLRASELAHRVGMSRPSMSRLVDRLERKGLVASTADPDDRRAVLLVSTVAGREALQDTRARRRQMVADVLDRAGRPLPEDLPAGLRTIVAALSLDPAEAPSGATSPAVPATATAERTGRSRSARRRRG